MEQRYIIDTNVIIDNFGGKLPERAREFLDKIDVNISAITKIEILGWPGATQKQLEPLYGFIAAVNILPINEQVIKKTILLRQSKK